MRGRAELAEALAEDDAPRAVVMTMGALHQGHFDLVAQAVEILGYCRRCTPHQPAEKTASASDAPDKTFRRSDA